MSVFTPTHHRLTSVARDLFFTSLSVSGKRAVKITSVLTNYKSWVLFNRLKAVVQHDHSQTAETNKIIKEYIWMRNRNKHCNGKQYLKAINILAQDNNTYL